ncbi:MAG: gliding motility-associated C-terminal domain-containing protein, partial [Flavobacteriales bacterium]
IYNRWGQVVYKTNNKDLIWDGTHKDTDKIVPDGVYYYVLHIDQIRLTGIETVVKKGEVHLLGGEDINNNE